jgi:hypothetical protein
MDHDCNPDADASRDEGEEDLKADAQTDAKSAHVLLSKLIAQMRNAQSVFVFKVSFLNPQQL